MSKPKKDYYQILGVKNTDTIEEIKRSYRKKAHEFHPDKKPNDSVAEEKFKEISEAYAVLSNPQEREIYDREISNPINHQFNPFDINSFDIFSNVFNIGNLSARMRVNPDNKIACRIRMENVLKGGKVTMQFTRFIACDKCFGRGSIASSNRCKGCGGRGVKEIRNANVFFQSTCNECKGTGQHETKCSNCGTTGYLKKDEKIIVDVPAGVSPMTSLKIQGKGNEVYHNGKKIVGDTYIVIDYPTQYKNVTLHLGNIYTSIKIPIDVVMAEETIKINVLDCKELELKLDSSKSSGHQYKLEKQGITENNCAMVKVFIDIPKNKISEDDRKKLVKLMRDVYGKPINIFEPTSIDQS